MSSEQARSLADQNWARSRSRLIIPSDRVTPDPEDPRFQPLDASLEPTAPQLTRAYRVIASEVEPPAPTPLVSELPRGWRWDARRVKQKKVKVLPPGVPLEPHPANDVSSDEPVQGETGSVQVEIGTGESITPPEVTAAVSARIAGNPDVTVTDNSRTLSEHEVHLEAVLREHVPDGLEVRRVDLDGRLTILPAGAPWEQPARPPVWHEPGSPVVGLGAGVFAESQDSTVDALATMMSHVPADLRGITTLDIEDGSPVSVETVRRLSRARWGGVDVAIPVGRVAGDPDAASVPAYTMNDAGDLVETVLPFADHVVVSPRRRRRKPPHELTRVEPGRYSLGEGWTLDGTAAGGGRVLRPGVIRAESPSSTDRSVNGKRLEVLAPGQSMPESVQANLHRILRALPSTVELDVPGQLPEGVPSWRDQFELAAVRQAAPAGYRAERIPAGYGLIPAEATVDLTAANALPTLDGTRVVYVFEPALPVSPRTGRATKLGRERHGKAARAFFDSVRALTGMPVVAHLGTSQKLTPSEASDMASYLQTPSPARGTSSHPPVPVLVEDGRLAGRPTPEDPFVALNANGQPEFVPLAHSFVVLPPGTPHPNWAVHGHQADKTRRVYPIGHDWVVDVTDPLHLWIRPASLTTSQPRPFDDRPSQPGSGPKVTIGAPGITPPPEVLQEALRILGNHLSRPLDLVIHGPDQPRWLTVLAESAAIKALPGDRFASGLYVGPPDQSAAFRAQALATLSGRPTDADAFRLAMGTTEPEEIESALADLTPAAKRLAFLDFSVIDPDLTVERAREFANRFDVEVEMPAERRIAGLAARDGLQAPAHSVAVTANGHRTVTPYAHTFRVYPDSRPIPASTLVGLPATNDPTVFEGPAGWLVHVFASQVVIAPPNAGG